MEPRIRQPAVADMFYPGDPQQLRQLLQQMLQQVQIAEQQTAPKAIIAPHAGYVYSGPVAASVYKLLLPIQDQITKVVLLGPSHRVPLFGCACSSASAFATPLGQIPLDRAEIDKILELPFVQELDEAHAMEHSLEVHLPFLQIALKQFKLIPIVVGECPKENVAQILNLLWGNKETLIVVSSDLSHYHDYDTANKMDAATSRAIESFDLDAIDSQHACGAMPVRGLLHLAQQKSLQVKTVDCRNSGDTAGPRNEVVGYGAYVIN